MLDLAAGLRTLATAVECDALPPGAVARLRTCVEAVGGTLGRDAALRALAGRLGRYGASRWATAQLLARRLREFEKVAYRRIRAGQRQPYDDVEALLCTVLDAGGAGARTIWGALQGALQKSGCTKTAGTPTADRTMP